MDTSEPWARRAPGTLRRTLPRTSPIFGDTLGDTPGTLRARRARETPVAGRRDRKLFFASEVIFSLVLKVISYSNSVLTKWGFL